MYKINSIIEKVERGDIITGANVILGAPEVSELYGHAGCDYVWIDMEHSPMSNKDVEYHIIGAHAGGAAAFVRLPWNDMVMAKQILDMGPDGVIIPLIKTVQDVKDAISFCSYPPKGVRGWNPIRAAKYGILNSEWYINNVDSLIWKILMIEDIEAVNNLEEILEIPEVDAIIIGPSDLSGSMGRLLQVNTEEFWAVAERICKVAKEAGKVVGVALPANCSKELLQRWIDKGVNMLSVGQDVNFLVKAVTENLQMIKDIMIAED